MQMLGSPMKNRNPTPDLDSRAVLDALRRLVRGLHIYARRCESSLGLSAAQLFALSKVHGHDGMSLRELADATLTDLSSVSVVATRLCRKGLLRRRRSPRDRRCAELSLTPSGLALMLRSPDTLQERLVLALKALAPARRKALARDLGVVFGKAGLMTEPVNLFFEEEA